MTFYPRRPDTVFDPNDNLAIDLRPASPEGPRAEEVIAAAFRQENVIGSLMSAQIYDGPRDPSFNPWDDIQGTEYEEYWDRFTAVGSSGESAALKRQIDMELEDRRTIAAAGGWGMLATIGAGVFSPENLLPGGALIRGARGSASVTRSAMSTASAAAISAGAAEMLLQGTQATRTAEESIFNIGGSALIGGLLGAGVAKLVNRADYVKAARQMETEALAATDPTALRANEAAMLRPGDAGAAARRVDSIDDLTIAGKAAQVAGGAVKFLNPALRVLHSPSRATRDIGTRLFENPVYLKKNMSGEASGPAVETLVKEFTQGAMARGMDEANGLYREYRKSGGALTRPQWNEAIGKAMRRGDQSDDPAISRAAAAWRKSVFDPLKEHAIQAGLLPKDVSVETALSYFTRVYNRPLIEAREPDFKAIVKRYIDREVRNAESRAELARLGANVDAPTKPPPDFLSDADRADYVSSIADDIYNTITGRNVDGDIPRDIVAAVRGPLKERTFNIPDSEIEEFLESNVEAVARRYARTMAADIELTRAFGKADLAEQIAEIRRDYDQLRQQVQAATGKDGKPLTQGQRDARIRELNAAEKNDIRDIQAVRDLVRGNYEAGKNTTNYARAARVAGQINYLRLMGGVTLSSLADIARPIMVHGLSNVMRDGLVPLISNLKGFKMSVGEAKIAGAVTERLLNTRMATWAEITDPYSVSSPFERFMDNTAAGFSKLNGLVYWNDFHKSFASVITQNRVLRSSEGYGQIGKRERAYLAYLGIDGSMAGRIARQFEKHGTTEDGGVRVAHTDEWDDDIARRTYRAAINKDVDSTIVSKGVADIPLRMNTPTGRLVMQFKSFAIASHQRVLMRGLQERPTGFVAGVMMAATAGMMIYYLKSVEANRVEDLNLDNPNPGRWIAEGLDRSGIFSVAFEVNNTVEKAFSIGAYGALAALFPDADQSGKASKYAQRGVVESLLGPTAALIDTAVAAGNAMKPDGKWTQSEINSLKRLVPGTTLPGIRSLVEYLGP